MIAAEAPFSLVRVYWTTFCPPVVVPKGFEVMDESAACVMGGKVRRRAINGR
jgi:hypothetical protein